MKVVILITAFYGFIIFPLAVKAGQQPSRPSDCDGAVSEVLNQVDKRGAIIQRVLRTPNNSDSKTPFPNSQDIMTSLEGNGENAIDKKRARFAAEAIISSPQLLPYIDCRTH